jgi:hypothetical protein
MRILKGMTLAATLLAVSACSTFSGNNGPSFPASASWGLLPMVNYSQTPQAGERSEQILLSVLSEEGIQPRVYPHVEDQDLLVLDDRKRYEQALQWAQGQSFDYLVSGSVEEWQYKNGLDGEPAVGISLRVLEPATGQVLWSNSGARAGWSRESLAGSAQKVLNTLIGDLRID